MYRAGVPAPGLRDTDLAILAFEQRAWPHPGEKEEAIRREFDISAARYYQVLNTLIDAPAALVHDPMLVRRLQRVRESRSHARTMLAGRPTPTGYPVSGRTRIDDQDGP
ncbi:MAG: DUF3263 domain-containing protein [Burkholderiaceae bacterium]|nr:DUF3263 domain-containing protein [Microbacteriaceae bacterium]